MTINNQAIIIILWLAFKIIILSQETKSIMKSSLSN